MPCAQGKSRPRGGVRAVALFAPAALAAACGQVLGLDGIDYDVGDGGTAHAPDAAKVDAPLSGSDASAADQASTEGQALPTGPVTLATGPVGAEALAIDDTRVYWVVGGASGSVLSVLKDGGDMVTIASGQASPVDIAVLGTSVYWSVAAGGPDPQCMAMVASTPDAVAGGADASATCVTTSTDQTVRMTLGGGSVVLLAQGTAAQANNEYIGYATPGTPYTNVETDGPAQALVATAQQVFLGNKNGFHVNELTLPGLTYGPIVCLTNCGAAAIVDMTTDVQTENVLWVTQGGGVFLASASAANGAGTQYAQLAATPQRMARDPSYIYVTALAKWVYAVPIAPGTDAGAIVTLSASEVQPFGIAVDESAVYWANASGQIRKASVPVP